MIVLAIPRHLDTDPILNLLITPQPVPGGPVRYLYQLVDATGNVLHGGSGGPQPSAEEPSTPQRALRVLAALLADEGDRLNADRNYGANYDEQERAALIASPSGCGRSASTLPQSTPPSPSTTPHPPSDRRRSRGRRCSTLIWS
jgi:hypothetical protein